MDRKEFILESPFAPTGDQPEAISKLVEDYKILNEKNKILFVSDDKTQSAFYKKRLETIYSLEIANSGQECLTRIRKKEEFDLINKKVLKLFNYIKENEVLISTKTKRGIESLLNKIKSLIYFIKINQAFLYINYYNSNFS